MPIGPSDLNFPASGERKIENWAKQDIHRGPDFSGLNSMFGSLMKNPSLIARGGTFTDPMQTQQDATSGYLQARGGVAQEHMSNIMNDAQLAENAGTAQGQILNLIDQLKASELGGQSSLFGSLLGGL